MAADLHIHAFEGITEDDLRAFFSNTFGSKYFNPKPGLDMELFTKIEQTPSIWIGSVSWLKAALTDEPETFVPSPVQVISEAIAEELPVLDNELAVKLLAAFDGVNTTDYEVAGQGDVAEFLAVNHGKRLFTVSW